ncbi:MAG: hypothetical protein EOO61_19205, partial [Hymenobacter sp.]
MATLTHHHEPAAVEQLELNPKLQRTFITIIGAGILLLIIGIVAAIMHIGEHSEAATHAGNIATHDADVHDTGSPWV